MLKHPVHDFIREAATQILTPVHVVLAAQDAPESAVELLLLREQRAAPWVLGQEEAGHEMLRTVARPKGLVCHLGLEGDLRVQHEELGGFLDGVGLACEKGVVEHLALKTLPLPLRGKDQLCLQAFAVCG